MRIGSDGSISEMGKAVAMIYCIVISKTQTKLALVISL